MRNPIRSEQIKAIHTLKSIAGICDDAYRTILGNYKVTVDGVTRPAESSKELDEDQASNVSGILFRLSRQKRRETYNNLGTRPGMATPAQLRKIAVMWSKVSFAKSSPMRQAALDKFLRSKFGAANLESVSAADVEKILFTLDIMRKQKERKNEPATA